MLLFVALIVAVDAELLTQHLCEINTKTARVGCGSDTVVKIQTRRQPPQPGVSILVGTTTEAAMAQRQHEQRLPLLCFLDAGLGLSQDVSHGMSRSYSQSMFHFGF